MLMKLIFEHLANSISVLRRYQMDTIVNGITPLGPFPYGQVLRGVMFVKYSLLPVLFSFLLEMLYICVRDIIPDDFRRNFRNKGCYPCKRVFTDDPIRNTVFNNMKVRIMMA